MAGDKLPSKAPWVDAVKKTGRLTLGLDPSLHQALWDKVFASAIFEFNKLSANYKLGVVFAKADDLKSANVEARAAKGDFDFAYPPGSPQTRIRFDGNTVHGLCKPALMQTGGQGAAAPYQMIKAFIYVPAAPMTDGRPIGDPVKLVMAVHEMVHACGLVSNDEHSVDDLFCWPMPLFGTRPSEDRVGAAGPAYTIRGTGGPGQPPARTGHQTIPMPPLFLKSGTIGKIRQLWS